MSETTTERLPRRFRARRRYQIVAHMRRWAALSAVLLAVSVAGLALQGLHLGLEFRGGAQFVVPASECTVEQARTATVDTLTASGQEGAAATVVQTSTGLLQVTTGPVPSATATAITETLGQTCGVAASDVKVQLVGPTWGGEITKKAITALAVFLVAVTIFLALYFEWRMALAALAALVHDIVITVGIYAWTGLEVTPATIIGFLTILGFSLYDTVVVFDKVKDNTKGIYRQGRQTYSQAANEALNDTIARSLNTSVVAMLPVAAILVIGVGLLGAGTLRDLATALLVGTATGTYSSLFVATPLLCAVTERTGPARELHARVAARAAAAASGNGAAASKPARAHRTGPACWRR